MIGSDRIQAVASYDGAFFPWFGIFNRRFGTPVRVNVMSGVVSTIFCFSAIAFFDSGANSTFAIVLTIAISTTLMSYLWIFLAALKLRYTHPNVPRPYRVPGKYGMWISSLVITGWVALGSFAAIFPGVLEELFGLKYDFFDNWGVTRGRYELYTFATLAIIIAFGIVGYIAGAGVRREVVQIEGDTPEPTAPVPIG
jgi:amino acid transporter